MRTPLLVTALAASTVATSVVWAASPSASASGSAGSHRHSTQKQLAREPHAVSITKPLLAGQRIVAPGGGFTLVMRTSGDLVELARDGQREWSSGTHAKGAMARVLRGGAFVIDAPGGHRVWSAGSGGHSYGAYRVVLQRGGALEVRNARGSVLWTNHLGSRCRATLPGRAVVVSIALQHLWACRGARLVMSTPVTTAATSRGWITPLGTWHVYAKERNVNLIGPSWDDHVHYWMPYSGPYGLHDATWQKFAEGSAKYKGHGSHGCVHVPLREMKRLFAWTRIGTRVTLRR
jgi:hypothetical protein